MFHASVLDKDVGPQIVAMGFVVSVVLICSLTNV